MSERQESGRSLRTAQLRQEFRSEIMRGYQAALCNSDVPGWTLGDEVAKVADRLLALINEPAAPDPRKLTVHLAGPGAQFVTGTAMTNSAGQR